MRIGIDAAVLFQEHWDGTRVLAREILPRLPRLFPRAEFYFYAPAPRPLEFRWANVRWIHWRGKQWAWMQRVLPKLVRQRPCEVLFLPRQSIPLRLRGKVPLAAVMLDLAYLSHPETFTWRNRLLLSYFTAAAVRDAQLLLAISQATRRSVARTFGRREGVEVAHLGVDRDLFAPLPAEAEEEKEQEENILKHRYHITKPYVLYVGAIQPRKNLRRLGQAFRRAKVFWQLPHRLVGVSGGGWREKEALRGVENVFHWRRQVSRRDLALFYRHAEVLVLPSLEEGFGLPLLEAMASGTPVIAADIPSLREVGGPAPLYVDPYQVEELRDALGELLSNPVLAQDLRERGLKWVAQFSWEKTAARVGELLFKIASR
jgi:glycosyltransferase involved in cell wall biosynthesis